MLYLGWIAAAFLAGVLLVLLLTRRAPSLKQRAQDVGSFRGMRYDEVIERLQSAPRRVTEQADGQTLRRWQDGNYSVTLLFDRTGLCMGVVEEHM